MNVKICGVRTPADALAAAEAGASMVGLVFVPASPRNVTRAEAEAAGAAEGDDGGGAREGERALIPSTTEGLRRSWMR